MDMLVPTQTPIAISEEYDEQGNGGGVVCHLGYIDGMITEAWEAEACVGMRTRDRSDVRVYITRKQWLPFLPLYSIYAHSNYIKPDMDYPTKVRVGPKISLLTILMNLLYLHMPSDIEMSNLIELHTTYVQYIVNERMFPKGDEGFFCNAANVRFVYARKPPMKVRLLSYRSLIRGIATMIAGGTRQLWPIRAGLANLEPRPR